MNIFNTVKRSYYSVPPNAFNMLNKIKSSAINNLKNNLYVSENTNCYDCYHIVKKYNLDYLPIKSNGNIIGILSKNDIEREVKIHTFNEEEEKTIRDNVRDGH